jgi:hypothetical protein
MVGRHAIHFETHQAASLGQKACDEIPQTGPASLSVDLLAKELREMQTGVRIIKADSWSTAHDSRNDAQSTLVMQLAAKAYPTGIIEINPGGFPEAGYFVGVLNFENAKTGEQYVVRVPFRVATSEGLGGITIALIAAALGAAGYYYVVVYKRRRIVPLA